MLSEEEIKVELEKAEFLYSLLQGSSKYAKTFWHSGYNQALRVVLGLAESDTVKEIKEFTQFEKVSALLEGDKQ